jgi:hypothetical protein
MAIAYNTSIVRDGLVLYLDAANPKSYPGTGTTINNLSNNLKNASMVGTTFSSENQESFIFDGVDDGVNISSFSITNNFSVEFWCLPESSHQIDAESTSSTAGTSGQKYLIGANNMSSNAGFGVSVGNNGVSVYEHGSGYMPPLLVHETTINSFTQITIVYLNKQPKLYINGVFIKNGLTSLKSSVFLIGNNVGYGDYGRYQGKLSCIKYYDRSLTDNEIKQNFEALRGRYGI